MKSPLCYRYFESWIYQNTSNIKLSCKWKPKKKNTQTRWFKYAVESFEIIEEKKREQRKLQKWKSLFTKYEAGPNDI